MVIDASYCGTLKFSLPCALTHEFAGSGSETGSEIHKRKEYLQITNKPQSTLYSVEESVFRWLVSKTIRLHLNLKNFNIFHCFICYHRNFIQCGLSCLFEFVDTPTLNPTTSLTYFLVTVSFKTSQGEIVFTKNTLRLTLLQFRKTDSESSHSMTISPILERLVFETSYHM